MNAKEPVFSFHLITTTAQQSAFILTEHKSVNCRSQTFSLVVKKSCVYFNSAGYLSCCKKAFSKTVEEKLHIWFTVVQVTAAETDFQWLLINLKTQIPHQLPVWRAPTFLYASVTCHLKSCRRCNRFQSQMVCINQCLQANKPNIRRFAQVVVSPYKVHAAQLIS